MPCQGMWHASGEKIVFASLIKMIPDNRVVIHFISPKTYPEMVTFCQMVPYPEYEGKESAAGTRQYEKACMIPSSGAVYWVKKDLGEDVMRSTRMNMLQIQARGKVWNIKQR
jgi:hypothetical protein